MCCPDPPVDPLCPSTTAMVPHPQSARHALLASARRWIPPGARSPGTSVRLMLLSGRGSSPTRDRRERPPGEDHAWSVTPSRLPGNAYPRTAPDTPGRPEAGPRPSGRASPRSPSSPRVELPGPCCAPPWRRPCRPRPGISLDHVPHQHRRIVPARRPPGSPVPRWRGHGGTQGHPHRGGDGGHRRVHHLLDLRARK
jgi:hypothetical protein